MGVDPARTIARETALSAAINAALSLVFFLAVFGWARPVAWTALGPDALPQSFMVALMAGLVPGLLVAAKLRAPRRPVVGRALLFAFLALAVGGGGQWLLFHHAAGTVAAGPALAAKTAYGAALGAGVTRVALLVLFRRHGAGGRAPTGT